MPTLQTLTVDGLERTDNGELDHHASFKTPDGIHLAVFDVESADSRNAYWLRAFEGQPRDTDNDVLAEGEISESIEPDIEDAVEMLLDMIVAARLERGAETVDDATDGLWERDETTDVMGSNAAA